MRPLPKNDEPEPTPTRRPPEEPQLRKKSVATTNGMSAGAIAGLSLGAVGVAGLIVGTVFGVRAVTIGDQSERCTLGPAGTGCPRAAVDRQDDARQAGTAATVSFAIGGALLAGGVTLFLLAPRAKSAPRTMQLRVGNPLSIAGVF